MLSYEVESCSKCDELVDCRSRIVNGVGSGKLGLLFVGEAPGKQEDDEGEPFVGRSGEILTEKLDDAGASRDEVRITNSVRCRPPENRDPRKDEISNCRGYLEAEIETMGPEVVCTLGRVPTSNLLGRSVTLGDVVGEKESVEIGSSVYDVVPCYHPAAMLYDRSKEESIEKVISNVVEMARS
ncbi:MAG: uracil-DNA glycosylase [Halobacteria archaeon]|nr:uracil-DNA glycosylase [Halobacteria archaeon]